MTTTIAGWQFKAIAKAAVPGTDDLAMFFGTFNMIAGLMSLVLQLVLTGRVLRTVGVGAGALHRADRDADGIDRACCCSARSSRRRR